MKHRNGSILTIVTTFCVLSGSALAQMVTPQQPPPDAATTPLFVNVQDLQWKMGCPELGERSGASVILHVDPKTQATQLLLRVSKNYEVPKHWHTANETHTVISGTFVFECDGKQEEQGPGSFNYMPSKMIHQGWTKDEETVLFVTVDGAWDINWVDRSACETALLQK
jgi:quercetin dioxygenase-like cupin family protein